MIYNVKFLPVFHFLCLLEKFWKQWQKFQRFFRYTLACNTNWLINLNWIGELSLQLKTGVFYVLSVVCCTDWSIIQSFLTIFGINFVNKFLFEFRYFTERTRFGKKKFIRSLPSQGEEGFSKIVLYVQQMKS